MRSSSASTLSGGCAGDVGRVRANPAAALCPPISRGSIAPFGFFRTSGALGCFGSSATVSGCQPSTSSVPSTLPQYCQSTPVAEGASRRRRRCVAAASMLSRSDVAEVERVLLPVARRAVERRERRHLADAVPARQLGRRAAARS